MNTELKSLFFSLAKQYSDNTEKISHSWTEIEQHYNQQGRYYHTLAHLQHMMEQLNKVQKNLHKPEIVWWSLYFHDFVYDAARNDNEERSALASMIHLNNLRVPMMDIMQIQSMILATKSHLPEEEDTDILFFLDADLSVLGSEEAQYKEYAAHIRKEYSIYSDTDYNAGRKKVLEHFMNMEKIYKTDFFSHLLEQKAKENLKKEWLSL